MIYVFTILLSFTSFVDKRQNENFYFQEKDIIAAKEDAVANAVQLAALQKSSQHHPWRR